MEVERASGPAGTPLLSAGVCVMTAPPPPPNTPINILIRLSICLPSTVVPLPASSSPVDPPSCFLLPRHHVLILAAPFRSGGSQRHRIFHPSLPAIGTLFRPSPSSRTASSGGPFSARQRWRTTSLLSVAPRETAAFLSASVAPASRMFSCLLQQRCWNQTHPEPDAGKTTASNMAPPAVYDEKSAPKQH